MEHMNQNWFNLKGDFLKFVFIWMTISECLQVRETWKVRESESGQGIE